MAQERVTYLFSKLWVVAIKKSYEIGSKFVIRISRWVLVKVVGLLLNIEYLPFLSQLTQKRVMYLFRKPWIVVNEKSCEIGGKTVMERSRWLLVKLLLFQCNMCGQPQDDATPSFFPDLNSSILGLSFNVWFVLELFWKGAENIKNVIRGQIYMEDPVNIEKYLRVEVLNNRMTSILANSHSPHEKLTF